MSVTTLTGRGRLVAGDLIIPVRYVIAIYEVPPGKAGLGSITAQFSRLDGQQGFWDVITKDAVLDLEDGRTWGCFVSDTGGAAANRTGVK
jgi:hypothetical protein